MVLRCIRTLLLTLVLGMGLVTLTAPRKGMESWQRERNASAATVVRELAGAPRPREKSSLELVRDGKNIGVSFSAAPWQSGKGYLESSNGSLLLATRSITEGDFHIRARLRMINQEASAASFFLGSSHFGFEGAKKTLYLNGPMFGGLKLLGSPNEFSSVIAGSTLKQSMRETSFFFMSTRSWFTA